MKKERTLFEEKVSRKNSKDKKVLKSLYDIYWQRPGIEMVPVEVPPDSIAYE